MPTYPNAEVMQNIVPIKMYEYLAMGKPVITTHHPGIMKEFGNDAGVVIVNVPEDSLNKSIELFSNELAIVYGKKGRKFVEKYDWKKITDTFKQVLRRAM